MLDWYSKPTSSGRYLNFHSYHKTSIKINLILGLKNRISKICHHTLRIKIFKKLKDILIDNSYPLSLVNQLLFRVSKNVHPILHNSQFQEPDSILNNTFTNLFATKQDINNRINNLIINNTVDNNRPNKRCIKQMVHCRLWIVQTGLLLVKYCGRIVFETEG